VYDLADMGLVLKIEKLLGPSFVHLIATRVCIRLARAAGSDANIRVIIVRTKAL